MERDNASENGVAVRWRARDAATQDNSVSLDVLCLNHQAHIATYAVLLGTDDDIEVRELEADPASHPHKLAVCSETCSGIFRNCQELPLRSATAESLPVLQQRRRPDLPALLRDAPEGVSTQPSLETFLARILLGSPWSLTCWQPCSPATPCVLHTDAKEMVGCMYTVSALMKTPGQFLRLLDTIEFARAPRNIVLR